MPVRAVHMCLEYLIKIHWCSFMPAGCGGDGVRREEGARENHKYTKKNRSWDERDNKEQKRKTKKKNEDLTLTDKGLLDANKIRATGWKADGKREKLNSTGPCGIQWPLQLLSIFLTNGWSYCKSVPGDPDRSSFSLRFNSTPFSSSFTYKTLSSIIPPTFISVLFDAFAHSEWLLISPHSSVTRINPRLIPR